MTNLHPDNARFRTLEDGTLLYRRNRSTRTYLVSSEQRDQISNLHSKEIAAAFLLAPPILGFAITSLEGDFGLVWQITGAYTLFYCLFNFVFSRNIASKLDAICLDAQPASSDQEIEIPGFVGVLVGTTATLSDPAKIAAFVFFLVYAAISFVIIFSAFWQISFVNLPELHWTAKVLIGASGILAFGTLAFATLKGFLAGRALKKNVRADAFR